MQAFVSTHMHIHILMCTSILFVWGLSTATTATAEATKMHPFQFLLFSKLFIFTFSFYYFVIFSAFGCTFYFLFLFFFCLVFWLWFSRALHHIRSERQQETHEFSVKCHNFCFNSSASDRVTRMKINALPPAIAVCICVCLLLSKRQRISGVKSKVVSREQGENLSAYEHKYLPRALGLLLWKWFSYTTTYIWVSVCV